MRQLLHYFKLNFLLYLLGRFFFIRHLYKIYKQFISFFVKSSVKNEKHEYVQWNLADKKVINDLRKNAVFIGLQLKENILQDVIRFSKNSKLWSRHERRGFSDFNEVHRFNKDNQKPCCLLYLTDPKLEKLSNSIARDKNLLRIANNHLGRVNKIDATVVWSPVCKADDEWRQKQQTIDFHYDVHGLNYLYVFFYITDCDVESGAHEMIIGSHAKKDFFEHLIGPARQTREKLQNFYELEKFVTISGKAGLGFFEDTSCFHRANAPISSHRLALQFRYS
mgnify:CR=1 FL=1